MASGQKALKMDHAALAMILGRMGYNIPEIKFGRVCLQNHYFFDSIRKNI
jgi:hypothetical protein